MFTKLDIIKRCILCLVMTMMMVNCPSIFHQLSSEYLKEVTNLGIEQPLFLDGRLALLISDKMV